ncbi:MAG: hypothetical protein FWG50_13330, partial [Kiritimatiellaeota bacterium]|nr:hypothetical protein [Kiritimatiellota bacterium]
LVFQVFRRALLEKQRIANIDFRKMKSISPACIVTFASYVKLWKEMQKGKPYPRFSTWQTRIHDNFTQMGVFQAMDMEDSDNESQKEVESPFRYMELQSFEVVENGLDVARCRIASLIGEIETFIKQPIGRTYFYQSVTEAILNIYHHAYTYTHYSSKRKKWWISVGFDVRSNRLHILVLDHGDGIPKTLMHSKTKIFMDFLTRFPLISKKSDADKLRVAFELGAKRAKTVGRGHGLSDILCYLESREQSSLVAWSGKGRYSGVHYKGKRIHGEVVSLEYRFKGTLLEWRIQL